MVQKRPLDDEQLFVSFKHPRQVGHSKELVSFSESVFPGDVSDKLQILDNGWAKDNKKGEEKLSDDIFSDIPKGGEIVEASAPGSFTNSSWTTSSTSEEDSLLEAPLHGSLFPEYFNPERPVRTLAQTQDIYSLLLDHLPRKSVSIGPEHQANVPLWGAQRTNANSDHLDTSEAVSKSDLEDENRLMGTCVIPMPARRTNANSDQLDISEAVSKFDLEDENRLMGTCVIPMPDLDLSSDADCIVGNGRTDCSCEDADSVRCVRQHILEARENLIKTIGPKRFEELGFNDIGEQVAQAWSEEEEQLFHQVVFSNPASSGKNFWHNLSTVFPSWTNKEIVSYYFNVFMLRKRAEQNRYEPMNVDSDNDEWQGSSDYGDNQLAMTEDEDSVVESPACKDVRCYNHRWKDDLQEYDEDVVDDPSDDNVNVNMFGVGTDRCYGLVDNCDSCPVSHFQDKIAWDSKGDQEVQDDSCTSFDTTAASQENQLKSENGNHWSAGFNGSSNRGDHEYVLEPCDAKIWDGYMTCPENKVDFLPTCNMIEEVFGKESWNFKSRDGKNLS